MSLAICVSVPLYAHAQESAREPAEDNLSTFLTAVPRKKSPPIYPLEALSRRREGWVALSFMISPEGEVTEPMIEESSGAESFEKAALEAVKKWRYNPATLNGQPVEDTITRAVIRFALESESGERPGVSNGFRVSYLRVKDSVSKPDLQQAASLLDELAQKERLSLTEDSWYWWLKYTYLDAAGSSAEEKRDALTRAIGYDDLLPPDLLVAASVGLYDLRVKEADYAGALRTLDRLKGSRRARNSARYAEVVKALDASAQQIGALIDGDTTLRVDAMIGEHDYWVQGLLRRSFSIEEIRGHIDSVEVRCTRRNARFGSVSGEHTWTIPKSWGDCGAYVKGNPGTTFVVYEPPNATK